MCRCWSFTTTIRVVRWLQRHHLHLWKILMKGSNMGGFAQLAMQDNEFFLQDIILALLHPLLFLLTICPLAFFSFFLGWTRSIIITIIILNYLQKKQRKKKCNMQMQKSLTSFSHKELRFVMKWGCVPPNIIEDFWFGEKWIYYIIIRALHCCALLVMINYFVFFLMFWHGSQ